MPHAGGALDMAYLNNEMWEAGSIVFLWTPRGGFQMYSILNSNAPIPSDIERVHFGGVYNMTATEVFLIDKSLKAGGCDGIRPEMLETFASWCVSNGQGL